jgi:hypothetical protein
LLPFIGYLASLTDAEYARDEAYFTRFIEQVEIPAADVPHFSHLIDEVHFGWFDRGSLFLATFLGFNDSLLLQAISRTLRNVPLLNSNSFDSGTYDDLFEMIGSLSPSQCLRRPRLTIVGEGHGPIDQDGLLQMLCGDGASDLSARAKELFFVVHRALSLFQQGKFADCLRICSAPSGRPVPEVLVYVEAAALLMLGMRKDARTSLEKMCTEQQVRAQLSADGQRGPADWTEADVVYFVRSVIAQKATWSFNC